MARTEGPPHRRRRQGRDAHRSRAGARARRTADRQRADRNRGRRTATAGSRSRREAASAGCCGRSRALRRRCRRRRCTARRPTPPPPAEEVAGDTVKSPMVGTAFLSPEPGAKPFIDVGKPVKAGDTLLIVEAMKVMNPITAPEGGVDQEDHRRRRPAGRVRPAAGDHRLAMADQQAADRQPRRDRASNPPRLPRDGHQDRRGPFDRRRRCDARAAGRRNGLHRPAGGDRILSQYPEHHFGRRDRPRRRHPPRLRLPLRERAVRRDRREPRHHLGRAEARAYPDDGRQDRGQAHRREARPAARSRLRWPDRPASPGQGARGRDRLSGPDQGGIRRRRARHEGCRQPRTSSKA